jgi:hypothetical protein
MVWSERAPNLFFLLFTLRCGRASSLPRQSGLRARKETRTLCKLWELEDFTHLCEGFGGRQRLVDVVHATEAQATLPKKLLRNNQ